jgi:hypothetical protein
MLRALVRADGSFGAPDAHRFDRARGRGGATRAALRAMDKKKLVDERGKPKFATAIVPDMWIDVDRVLARVPRELDLLRIASCPAFAAAAKEHRAIGVLQVMQGVCERYYLPLFFEVLRAASLRPLVREKYARAEASVDAEVWSSMFEVPWSGPDVRSTEPKRTLDRTSQGRSAAEANGTRRAK